MDGKLTLDQLYQSLHEFVIVLIHVVLYVKNVYPKESFQSVRQYHCAVWQNMHPGVQEWVENAATTVASILRNANTRQFSILVLDDGRPVERYVLDTSHLPPPGTKVDLVDALQLAAEYKAVVVNVLNGECLQNSGSNYTISLLIDGQPTEQLARPNGPWIVADAAHVPEQQEREMVNVHPIRFIDAGPFSMSLWRESMATEDP